MSVEGCQDTYVVVDLETTGLQPASDRILEIGAVKVVKGEVKETFCTFADPKMEIPPYIQELTGITQEMVEGEKSPEAAVLEFLEFCGELDLMGHNLMFDYSFLKHQAVNQRRTFEKNGIDTLKIARKLLPDLESRSLTSLCDYFQIDRKQAHRAFHDALATHQVYKKLQECAIAGQEKEFAAKPLQYKVKRQGPITEAQKRYLNDLIKYHKIKLNVAIESLTKNEASRRIDQIISEYGKIKR